MNRCVLLAVFLSFAGAGYAQTTGEEVLVKMHRKYKEGMCKNYTFSQRNTHYSGDTIIGESVWHESVGLPDKFRIVFGDSARGNSVLFRNDSVYHYKRSQLVKSDRDSNSLLLLLGGMYYRDIDAVKNRLISAGFNVSKLSEQRWLNRPVYVIGAAVGDLASPQIWVDKNDLVLYRIIDRINSRDMMDMRFESHQPWCKGLVENKVTFRRNGVLEQVEEYYDLKERESFR